METESENRSQKVFCCGTVTLRVTYPCVTSFGHTPKQGFSMIWLNTGQAVTSHSGARVAVVRWKARTGASHTAQLWQELEKRGIISALRWLGIRGPKKLFSPTVWMKAVAHRESMSEDPTESLPWLFSWKSQWVGEHYNKPQMTTEIIGRSFYADCLDISCSFWNSLKNIPHLEFLKPQGENWEATIFSLATLSSFYSNNIFPHKTGHFLVFFFL